MTSRILLVVIALRALSGCGPIDPSLFCPNDTCEASCAGKGGNPPSSFHCPEIDCSCPEPDGGR